MDYYLNYQCKNMKLLRPHVKKQMIEYDRRISWENGYFGKIRTRRYSNYK